MCEQCAAKDKLLVEMDKLLARAADALNNGMRMSEMDLGSEITEYRRRHPSQPQG